MRWQAGVWMALSAAVLMAGCATQKSEPAANTSTTASTASGSTAPTKVKSRDGKFEGEVFGKQMAGGKFGKVQIGMEYSEVTALIGAPVNMKVSETGKRWIPFYYGNDVKRMQTLYKGEGCLSFTGGNHWGGGGNELVAIHHDPSGKCYD
jgi:hypothetical protein